MICIVNGEDMWRLGLAVHLNHGWLNECIFPCSKASSPAWLKLRKVTPIIPPRRWHIDPTMCGAWWRRREMSSGGLVSNDLGIMVHGHQFTVHVIHIFWYSVWCFGRIVFWIKISQLLRGCHLAPLQCWLSAGDLGDGRKLPSRPGGFHGKIIETDVNGGFSMAMAMTAGGYKCIWTVQCSIFFDLFKVPFKHLAMTEVAVQSSSMYQGCGTAARPAVLTSQALELTWRDKPVQLFMVYLHPVWQSMDL